MQEQSIILGIKRYFVIHVIISNKLGIVANLAIKFKLIKYIAQF